MRLASLVSLYVPGTCNDVFCLPTTVGFLCVLSMHVPGERHESFIAGGECHAQIPDDSGAAPCTYLTVPSLGKESSLASLLLPSWEGYLSATVPSRHGRGLEQRPIMPCQAEPQCTTPPLLREVAPELPTEQSWATLLTLGPLWPRALTVAPGRAPAMLLLGC
jgi:hypothetical protein